MPDEAGGLKAPRRIWLFAPSALLLIAAVGWSAAWFTIRGRTAAGLEAWLASEARSGRDWRCQDRSVGGFPFRIEVDCASLRLRRPGLEASFGRVLVVAQVYQPRHFIAEIAGPLQVKAGALAVAGEWKLLRGSLHYDGTGLQRLSVVGEGATVRIAGALASDIVVKSDVAEAHLRPDPERFSGEGAYDLGLRATGLVAPGLDQWLGGREPASLDASLVVTEMRDPPSRPPAEEIERWREAGGKVELVSARLTKGPRRLEGKGEFGLDEAHRLRGRLDLAGAGLDGLIGTVTGGAGGLAGALMGALAGKPAPSPAPGQASSLKPLPPLRADDGRLMLGALTVPGIRLSPVY